MPSIRRANKKKAEQGQNPPTLTMKYAGGLVKHLGLQMYSGAVPSIAELVKNAYDANAKEVNIIIPFGESWDATSSIVVRDNGNGMSFEDCDDKYLVIGRDRRKEEGDKVEGNSTRRPLGRKGIGKLAGFGIADVINVRTIKTGKRSQFEMDYSEIERLSLGEEYHPDVIEAGVRTRENKGTVVTLTKIKLQRAIQEQEFRYSMSKRFALLSGDFIVKVNGQPLLRDEIELQFRFPDLQSGKSDNRFNNEDVPGCGTIKWWMGFTELPIKRDEDRGVVVMVRNVMAQQTPFFFGLTGGAGGQLGLQYITGEVYANFLDRETIDAIATDRGSINWEKEEARPLLEWGQKKIRQLLTEWSNKRREAQENRLIRHTKYIETVQRFPERQRSELIKAITKIASIETIEDERLDELVAFLIEAYERADIITIIRQLMAASPTERAQIFEALSEWDVIEAISFAQIVRGRLAIIDKFEELIESGTPEKVPDREDMQTFLASYPLLIDASLTLMEHEKSLDGLLVNQFHRKKSGTKEGKQRVDFFCLRDSNNIVIVEVKGADIPAGKKEVRQLIDYVEFFQEKERAAATDPRQPHKHVTGYLIAKHLTADGQLEANHALPRGVMFRPWKGLSGAARQSHKDFYEIAKRRVKPGDPRIESLEKISSTEK